MPYNLSLCWEGVRALQRTSRTMSRFDFCAECDVWRFQMCYVQFSVPELCGVTGCDVARKVETACRLCFSPRLQIDVFLPLFCANRSSDAVKGACFHPLFTGPLGDRREEKFRCTALHRNLWRWRSDFLPYLMSTLWRWWQPHPAELPDSWGAWKDAHTSSLLLYLLYGEWTSTEEKDGGDHHLMHHTQQNHWGIYWVLSYYAETLKHKHRSLQITFCCYLRL